MVALSKPLMSLLATGKLAHCLQFQFTGHGVFLTKAHSPPNDPTAAQHVIRSYTRMLAFVWRNWAPLVGYTWATHPNRRTLSPYHCFLYENHRRRTTGRWPIVAYDTPPSGPAPQIAQWYANGMARAIVAKTRLNTGNHPVFFAQWIGAIPAGGVKPQNVLRWDYNAPSQLRQIDYLDLDPGTYTHRFLQVDGFGQPGALRTTTGVVVTP